MIRAVFCLLSAFNGEAALPPSASNATKDRMDDQSSIQDALQTNGLNAMTLSRTLLIRDHRFEGIKYLFDGGYAVQLAGEDIVNLYDNDGNLIRTGLLGATNQRRVA